MRLILSKVANSAQKCGFSVGESTNFDANKWLIFSMLPHMEASKKKVYIETTIPSFITARLSGDIGILFRQQKAMEFWENGQSL